ncbi:unnamed protein product, partial [Laminaria digitata]
GRGGGEAKGSGGAEGVSIDERLHRLEKGVELWGGTYVPPIAPEEWQRLVDKWTSVGGNGTAVREQRFQHVLISSSRASNAPPLAGAPRILFVVTSFDRGGRLGRALKGVVDKLDYMLMIMDEIREACEVRF